LKKKEKILNSGTVTPILFVTEKDILPNDHLNEVNSDDEEILKQNFNQSPEERDTQATTTIEKEIKSLQMNEIAHPIFHPSYSTKKDLYNNLFSIFRISDFPYYDNPAYCGCTTIEEAKNKLILCPIWVPIYETDDYHLLFINCLSSSIYYGFIGASDIELRWRN